MDLKHSWNCTPGQQVLNAYIKRGDIRHAEILLINFSTSFPTFFPPPPPIATLWAISMIWSYVVFRDYRPISELDRYDPEALDDEGDFSEMSMTERLAAERELRKRDHDDVTATGRMRPGILYGMWLLSVKKTLKICVWLYFMWYCIIFSGIWLIQQIQTCV